METRDPGRPRPREEPAGLAPVRAFFAVGAAATVILGLFAATREATPREPAPAPARSPDYALTEAEAIAEFERLNTERVKAYKSRDLSLLHEVIAPTSPLLPRGEREIKQLLHEKVLLKSRFVTEDIEVVTNTETEIVVRQMEDDFPKFVDESGRDVTDDRSPRRRVIEWTLRRVGTKWWIFDSKLIAERRLS